MTVFSPFIPHNDRDSSMPVALFKFTIENHTDAPIDYTLAATLGNYGCDSGIHTFYRKDALNILHFTAADGGAPEQEGDLAMEAAACIGCGACAAACPNASAMLFTAAKVSHLALLPQGSPERTKRVVDMVNTMDAEGFGNCTNTYECEAVCPAEISASFIAKLNREYSLATLKGRDD